MKKMNTKLIVLAPIFTALSIVGAFLRIDLPLVPLTFQLFFCVCAGLFLGSKGSALSQILYALLGLIGLPVFTSGLSGLAALQSPTFGYILGFPFAAYLCGWLRERFEARNSDLSVWKITLCSLLALVVDYIAGVSYLYFISNVYLDGISLFGAVLAGSGLFFVKDFVLCFALSLVAGRILKALRLTDGSKTSANF